MSRNESAWRCVARWGLLAAALNLAWEVAQLPLYTIYQDASAATIAYAVAHCTLGDVLIALSSYFLAMLLTKTANWPVQRPLAGGVTLIVLGVSYTAVSEWLNVSVRQTWAYSPAMPQVLGIGAVPLLQWLLLPTLGLVVVRASDRGRLT